MLTQLPVAIKSTQLDLPNLEGFYKGKVRDVYDLGNLLVMVATDRISAFDVVLPKAIPHKGQVLNQIAAHFLHATADIVPNWLEATPHSNIAIGKKCKAFPVEMVIRGYLVGHAWRLYKAGNRSVCGVALPDGLSENDKLPTPIITPTTKAAEGHDADISKAEILEQGLVSASDYEQLEHYTYALYAKGVEMAAQQGLILVDTKYEFGLFDGQVTLIDEIHTPDSSRYFYAEGYEERQKKGVEQKQLSKEFVRRWLIDNGFQGLEGQTIPEMTDDWIKEISDRYIELYERVTGAKFVPYLHPDDVQSLNEELTTAVLKYLV